MGHGRFWRTEELNYNTINMPTNSIQDVKFGISV